MRNLFEINDIEKSKILELHINATKKLYLTEQESIIKATTDPVVMPNFTGTGGNSRFGLKGDKSKENFLFKSTIGDIINRSRGDESEYLSGFVPTTDNGTYINFLKIGQNEITNSGSITFDLTSLPDDTEVIGTHNGLLLIKRMMDQIKGRKRGKVTLTMSSAERVSSKVDFSYLTEINKLINANLNGIASALSVLFTPQNERSKITESYAKTNFANDTDEIIKNKIAKLLKSGLVRAMLTNEDKSNIDSIIEEQGLVGNLDISVFEPYFGKGKPASSVNEVWKTFQDTFKQTLKNNLERYMMSYGFSISPDIITNIQTSSASKQMVDEYDRLFKSSTIKPGTPTNPNRISQSDRSYELGK